jgi:integrase/recombinase XerD
MQIQVNKVVGTDNQVYIGISTRPQSKQYELIKTCTGVKWNADIKLWVMPRTNVAWVAFKEKFKGYEVIVNQHEISLISGQVESKNPIKRIVTHAIEKPLLNTNQYDALCRLKEQLVIKQYAYNTSKSYCSGFVEFMVYYKDKNVSDINLEDIRKFLLHKIQEHKISESTQNNLINAIKFYYEKVEKKERFVMYDLRPRPTHKLPDFLSKEETVKLLKATENLKHRCILQLIYSSGMRLSEVTKLKIRDVKFDMDIIEIKGAKGKKDRISMLSPKVKILIAEYMTVYNPKFYMFEGQTGGKYSDRSVQQIMQNAVIKSGVNENATVHTLRHSFATHMVLNGVDLRKIQEYLGHASLETTAIYTHITDKMKTDIKSPIDDLDI